MNQPFDTLRLSAATAFTTTLLHHVGRAYPQSIPLLRPGGVVCVIDVAHRAFPCYYAPVVWFT